MKKTVKSDSAFQKIAITSSRAHRLLAESQASNIDKVTNGTTNNKASKRSNLVLSVNSAILTEDTNQVMRIESNHDPSYKRTHSITIINSPLGHSASQMQGVAFTVGLRNST